VSLASTSKGLVSVKCRKKTWWFLPPKVSLLVVLPIKHQKHRFNYENSHLEPFSCFSPLDYLRGQKCHWGGTPYTVTFDRIYNHILTPIVWGGTPYTVTFDRIHNHILTPIVRGEFRKSTQLTRISQSISHTAHTDKHAHTIADSHTHT